MAGLHTHIPHRHHLLSAYPYQSSCSGKWELDWGLCSEQIALTRCISQQEHPQVEDARMSVASDLVDPWNPKMNWNESGMAPVGRSTLSPNPLIFVTSRAGFSISSGKKYPWHSPVSDRMTEQSPACSGLMRYESSLALTAPQRVQCEKRPILLRLGGPMDTAHSEVDNWGL